MRKSIPILILILMSLVMTCDLFKVGLGDEIDIEPPEFEVESHDNGDYVSGTITVHGTGADDIGVKSVTLTLDGKTYEQALKKDGTWAFTIDTTTFEDGEKDIALRITDTSAQKKTEEKKLLLNFDNSAPTVLVTVPQSYGDDSRFNKTITIKGEAADVFRIEAVRVKIYSAGGGQINTDDDTADGTVSWNYSYSFQDGDDGTYYVVVEAEDYAGNINRYFYHRKDLSEITVPDDSRDLSANGEITVETLDELDRTRSDSELVSIRLNADRRMELLVSADSDKPVITISNPSDAGGIEENVLGANPRLIGMVEDDDGESFRGVDTSSITVQLTGYEDSAPVLPETHVTTYGEPGGMSVRWEYPVTGVADGSYTLTVRAKDLGSAESEATVSFKIDSSAPEVTITSPEQGSYIGASGTLTIEGTARDGDRIDSVRILDAGDNVLAATTLAGTPSNRTWTGNLDLSGIDASDGMVRFSVEATDGAGKTSRSGLVLVRDTVAPEVFVESPAESEELNGTVSIRGTASDDSIVSKVEIAVGKEAIADEVWTTLGGVSYPYIWEYAGLNTVPLMNLDDSDRLDTVDGDGNPITTWRLPIRVRVTDAAGTSSTRECLYTINPDADDPYLSFYTLDTVDFSKNNLEYNTRITGAAGDDDGVLSVELRVDGDPETPEAGWEPIWVNPDPAAPDQKKEITWEYDLADLALEGWHTLETRVNDINSGDAQKACLVTLQFGIDRAYPSLTVLPASGGFYCSDFQLTGTAEDGNGIQDITIKNGQDELESWTFDSPFPTSHDYTYTVYLSNTSASTTEPKFGDGPHTFTVVTTDGFDKVTERSVSLTVDTIPPTVTFSAPDDSSTVNGKVLMKGTASDGTPVTGVYLQILPTGQTPDAPSSPKSDAAWAAEDWTKLAGTSVWEYSLDTTLLDGAQPVYPDGECVVYVRAVDTAGNVTSNRTVGITIDQGSDLPVIELSNLDLSETVEPVTNVFGNGARILGIARDDDRLDSASIQIKLDENDWTAVSNPGSSSLYVGWSHDLSAVTEGIHEVRFRASDDASKKDGLSAASLEVPAAGSDPIVFLMDKNPPSLRNVLPAPGSYHNKPFTIEGEALDGIEVSSVQLSFNGSDEWKDAVLEYETTEGSENLYDWSYDIPAADFTALPGGAVQIRIKAVDRSGKIAEQHLQLFKDDTPPTVAISVPGPESTVNGAIAVSGTASDNLGLDAVWFRHGTSVPAVPDESDAAMTGWTRLDGTYAWKLEPFDTLLYNPDSEPLAYYISVIAVDTAGNRSVKTDRMITIDQESDRPVIACATLDTAKDYLQNLLPSNRQITGTVTDDDAVESTLIRYRLLDASGAEIEPWTAVSVPPAADGSRVEWRHTLGAHPDGTYRLELRAADVNFSGAYDAGSYNWNTLRTESGTPAQIRFVIDTADPGLDETGIGTSAQVIKSDDFVITGSSGDENGLASLRITAARDGVDQGEVYNAADDPEFNLEAESDTYLYTKAVEDHSADGLWLYTITATDAVGKSIQLKRTVLLDTTAPEPPVITSEPGSYVTGNLVIGGTASDDTGVTEQVSGLERVEYRLDGAGIWTKLSGTDEWSGSANVSGLPEGSHTVEVRSRDRAGWYSTPAVQTFVIDRYDPQITVDAAYDQTGYKNAEFTIGGVFSDTLPLGTDGTLAVGVTRNGTPVAGLPAVMLGLEGENAGRWSRSWSQTVPVTAGDGTYVITITAEDAAGRPAEASRTVVVDRTPPSVTVSNLVDDQLIRATEYTVSGTAGDGTGSGLDRVQYSVNGGSNWTDALGGANWTVVLTGLTEGLDKPIAFRALDKAGNSSVPVSRTYRVDTGDPSIAGVTLSPAVVQGSVSWINGNASLGFTAGDTHALKSVSITRDGVNVYSRSFDPADAEKSFTDTVTLETGALAEGEYEYTISVYDAVDNSFSVSRTIGLDTLQPELDIAAPAAGEYVESTSYLIEGRIDDLDGKGVTSLEYSRTGADGSWLPITFTGSRWSVSGVDFSGGGEGEKTLYVRASDGLNDPVTETVGFFYDTAAPTLVEGGSEYPAGIGTETVVYRTDDFTLAGGAEDSNALSRVTVEVSKNGGALTPVTDSPFALSGTEDTWDYTMTVGAAGIDDGTYAYTITVYDIASRPSAQIRRTVVVDTLKPVVSVTSPAASVYVQGPSLALNGSVTDANPVAEIEYRIDGAGEWTDATGTNNWYGSVDLDTDGAGGDEGLGEGAHTIEVRARDAAGLWCDPVTVSFTVDQFAPTLTETTLGEAVGRNTVFSLGGTAEDTVELGSLIVLEDGTEILNTDLSGETSPYMWSVSNLPSEGLTDGTYTYTISFTDGSGKPAETISRTVTIDQTAPGTNTITAPSAGQTGTNALYGDAYTFRGTASDAGVGVAKVYYLISDSAAAPAGTDEADGWTPIATSGNWSFSMPLDKDAGAAGVGELDEGRWYLHVKAEDRAGNVTESAATLLFDVDQAVPSLTETAVGPATVNRNTGFGLNGAIGDTHGIVSVQVWQSKDGGAETEIDDGGPISNLTTSWSQPNLPRNPADIGTQVTGAAADGLYVYRIVVTDVVGKRTELGRTVHFDASAPEVSYSNLSPEGEDPLKVFREASPKILGSITDASGVDSYLVRIDPYDYASSTWIDGTPETVDVADNAKTVSVSKTLTQPDGLYRVTITPSDVATPVANTQTSPETVEFYIDRSAPTVSGLTLAAGTNYRSGDFTLGFTANDTHQLDAVRITQDGVQLGAELELNGTSYLVSVPVDADALDEEVEHVYEITVIDKAGTETVVSRTVTIDKTAPSIVDGTVTAGARYDETDGTVKLNGIIGFRFSASDDSAGIEKTGANYAAYYTVAADGVLPPAGVAAADGWVPISSATQVFSFSYDTSDKNGEYDLYIRVRDAVASGPNIGTEKFDLSIDQESDRPVITLDNLVETTPLNSENGFGQNPIFLLTIEDDDKVDVSELEYRIDANNDGDFEDAADLVTAGTKWENETVWNKVEEVPANDSPLVQAKIKLTDFPQGAFGIQIRARDTTKPASGWTDLFLEENEYSWTVTHWVRHDEPTPDEYKPILYAVDYGPPTITVTSPVGGTFNGDFTLSGTASDALGITNVRYTVDGLSYVTLYDVPGSTLLSKPFTTTVLGSAMDTGEYILQVEATDFGGTTAVQKIPITIDRKVPEVELLQPGESSTMNGASVTVRGEASDNRQLGAVFLWHGLVSDPDPAELPSRTGSDTYDPGSYTRVTGAAIWNHTIDTTAVVNSGENGYRIRLVAVDSIGNVSVPEDFLMTVNQETDRPIIHFSNLSESGQPSRLALGNLSIIGSASDDDSVLADSIQIRINRNGSIDTDFDDAGEGWIDISAPPANDALVVSWVHSINDLASEGLHHIQVRALDINASAANRSIFETSAASDGLIGYTWRESAVVPFYIDNGPPALEVTSPTLGQRFNVDHFTVTGTASDTNGISKITIWVDNDGDAVQDLEELTTVGWIDGNANGLVDEGEGALTSDNTQYSLNRTISGLSDGTKTVRVTAYDTSFAQTVREFTVVIDTSAPSAEITTPGNGSTVNGTIPVVGTATDNYQVSEVYYSVQPTDGPDADTDPDPAPVFPGAAHTKLEGQTYAWNFNLDTTDYADGEYTLWVVVVDGAGNNSSASPAGTRFTIDQETDKPVIEVLTIDATKSAIENLLPGSLQVSGTISDDDSVNKDKIEIRWRNLADPDVWSGWNPITGKPAGNTTVATWSHKFDGFTDGQYEFELRAADINDSGTWAVGEYSWSVLTGVRFAVDLKVPAGAISAPDQASFLRQNVMISGSSSDESGIKRISIAYDTTGTGYGAEKVLVNDTDPSDGYALSQSWSDVFIVTGSNDGQVYARVTIVDAFDKERTLERYFTVDTKAPTISFQQPGAGSTLNGSVLVRGGASDVNRVEKVWFKVNNSTGAGTVWETGDDAALEGDGWTLLGGTYTWEQRFKSTDLDGGAAAVYIMAVDTADNRSDPTAAENRRSFTVDQTTNLPVITLTTPNNSLLDDTGVITGTILDDDGVDVSTMRIWIGGTAYVVTNPGVSGPNVTFSHSVSGLAEDDELYSVYITVDDIGEDFDGTEQDIAPVSNTSSSISIRKDDTLPVADITSLNNGIETVTTLSGAYVSGKILITGTATDGVGVNTVQVRLPGITGYDTFGLIPVTDTNGDEDAETKYDTWSWEADNPGLSGGSQLLEVRVTDLHSRESKYTFTLLVDKGTPSVSFVSTSANPDTVSGAYNGTVTFRGGSTDNVMVNKVYYRFEPDAFDPGTDAPDAVFTGWTKASSTYSWTTDPFDTREVHDLDTDLGYHLWAVSTDSAGNVSNVEDLPFAINQGSDRPVLTLTAPAAGQVLQTNAKALGTVKDDDGLASVQIRIDLDNDGEWDPEEVYTDIDTPDTVSGKNITIEHILSGLSDGFRRLQLRVRDSVFDTAVPGNTPFNEIESAVIPFSIDTLPPAITLDSLTIQNRYGVGTRVITENINNSYVNNDFFLTFTSTDSSGIAAVEISLDNSTWSDDTFDPPAGDTYVSRLPISSFSDGTRLVYYRARDNNGKVTAGMVTLLVDNGEPDVDFSSPDGISTLASDEAPNVNGTVTITGLITDASTIESLIITGGNGDEITFENDGDDNSWKIEFDSTQYDDIPYATKTGDNTWRLPIKVTAADAAGNRTVTTGYVDLDPNGDKPIVSISAPANNARVTGIIAVNGTVTDDDGTSGTVKVELDTDNDGTWDMTDLPPVNVVSNAWTAQINDPTTLSGWVGIRVTPTDKNGVVGDSMTRTIFIDSSLPQIVGWNGSMPELPAPTPVTGERLKGEIEIHALFKDDDEIPTENMKVSLDGGSTYTAIEDLPVHVIEHIDDANGYERYYVRFKVNTTTYFPDNSGNGTMSVILSVSDRTYKPAVASLSYAVDNRPPEIHWDADPAQLTPIAGLYQFFGSGSTVSNKVIGRVADGGTISGVSYVDVFFMKDGQFHDPKGMATPTAATYAEIGDGLYTQAAFTAGTVNPATDTLTIDRTTPGTLNNDLPVRFIGSSLPGGLNADTLYYIRDTVGNSFRLYTAPIGGTPVDITGPGTGGILEYAVTDVPYSTDMYAAGGAGSHFGIRIDARTELGSYDEVPDIGDQDGFQESLKNKGGYDEWFAYFDSAKLPDGPLSVYYIAYDENGNKVFGSVNGQVMNNPPSITGFSVGGTAAAGSPELKVKASGTTDLVIDAIDIGANQNIVSSTWKVTVEKEFAVNPDLSIGDENLAFTPFYYGTDAGGDWIRDFSSTAGGGTASAHATVSIDTAGDGYSEPRWYLVTAQVNDIDGNLAVNSFYMLVNNTDTTRPTAEMNGITRDSIAAWTKTQGPVSVSVPEASVNAGTDTITAALPAWVANGHKVAFAGSASPEGLATAAVYYVVEKATGTFKLSATPGGPAVDITNAGTGPYRIVSGGYVEDASSFDGVDPDTAGAVFLTGTAWDDNAVSSVKLEISYDGGASWAALGTARLGTGTGSLLDGYTYPWTFLWNTAEITGTADDDVMIRAYATDARPNETLEASRPVQQADVMPYITEIRRNTVGFKTNRSRYGRYSVHQGETDIQVIGFNLNPANAGINSENDGSGTQDSLAAPGNLDPGRTSFTVAMGASTRSGWLRIDVNGYDALNNNNGNDVGYPYNQAYGTDGQSADWTDDRYFSTWQVGDYFFRSNVDNENVAAPPQHPAMTIRASDSVLFGAWSSYASSDVFLASPNSAATDFRSRIYHTYDTAETVDIAMNSAGRMAIAWLGNNSSDGNYGDGHICVFPYERTTGFINGDVSASTQTGWPRVYNPAGEGETEDDRAVNLPSDAPQWNRASFDNWYYQGEGLGYDAQLYQFDKIRTARNGDYTHWAYYDRQSKTVKYQVVHSTETSEAELTSWINIDGPDTDTDGNEENDEVPNGNGIARTTATGEHLALALDEDGRPLVVYFDDTAKMLRLARSSTATPAAGDETVWTRQWVLPANDPNNPTFGSLTSIGMHISAAVDPNGYLHIAFWSEDTGYLYYIRSSNDADGATAYSFNDSEIVDMTGTAGTWSDVTLKPDTVGTAPYLPYISYLNTARLNTRDGLKVAWYDSVKGGWEWTVAAANTPVVEKRLSIEYKRGGTPAWDAAIGYASQTRFEIIYMMPEIP